MATTIHQKVSIIGMDSATDPKNIGLVKAIYEDDQLQIQEVWIRAEPPITKMKAWVEESHHDKILLAIDSPLGWPHELGTALHHHLAGKPLGMEIFPRRITDIKVKEVLGKTPFDVGAGFIARTAHASLKFMGELNGFEMVWSHDFTGRGVIEVYPGATLVSYFDTDPTFNIEYKAKNWKKFRSNGLSTFLEKLTKMDDFNIHLPNEVKPFIKEEHDFDALLCCLAAADFLRDDCVKPDEINDRLRKEGWIWFRQKGK